MDERNVTRAELERLQTEQSYQTDTLQALNDALSAQQLEILELRHALRLLEARLRELATTSQGNNTVDDDAPEAPPPHY
ncbi:MAG: SlyX family protein [Chromatocurvus sp.]